MKVIVIGCGRVGSTIAKQLLSEGWDVTAVDEKEDALARLGDDWPGGFVLVLSGARSLWLRRLFALVVIALAVEMLYKGATAAL